MPYIKIASSVSGLLLLITLFSSLLLSSTIIKADSSTVDTIEVTVNTACTMSSSLGTTSGVTATADSSTNTNTYTTSLNPETVKEINGSILSTVCNDVNGYSLYAIGYSGNSYDTPNNNKLLGTNNNINTGTNTTGDSGSWSMKLAAVSGYTPPTILNSFNNYHNVPATYTQIAKYTSVTSSAASVGATIQTKYQVYTGNEAYGSYTGKVKYTMVHPNDAAAPVPPTPMQSLTLSQCQVNVGTGGNPAGIGDNITVYDRRDGNNYTVRYINGQCWMTQNLRLTGTVSATDSNFTGNDFNVSEYSLDSADSSYTNHCNSTNSYNHACAKDSGNTTIGTWYNYYAVTAGTIGTNSNTTPATEDICPTGWHLPSGPNTTANTDINKLVGNTTSGWQQNLTSGMAAFSPVVAGYYYNGSLHYQGYGHYWSSIASSDVDRYSLYFDGTHGSFSATTQHTRWVGVIARCVKSS